MTKQEYWQLTDKKCQEATVKVRALRRITTPEMRAKGTAIEVGTILILEGKCGCFGGFSARTDDGHLYVRGLHRENCELVSIDGKGGTNA